MKKVAFIFILLLVLMGCLESSSKDANQILGTKLAYSDFSTQNKDYGNLVADGQVEITTVKPHSGSISGHAFFKQWKPYEKLDVYREWDTLKIYYTEKDTDEKQNIFISFPLGFHAFAENTQIYKNGVLQKDNIQFSHGIE